MAIPYVHSGYERKENDDYQTLDKRCVTALLQSCSGVLPSDICTDICGSHGSGIVRHLQEAGYTAQFLTDAFTQDVPKGWIITNPPYERRIVDSYVERALSLCRDGKVNGAFFLMRANWDFAASRKHLFDNEHYSGQIRMRFRPWWTEERKAQPIHNYVWHIWTAVPKTRPTIMYWPK
jgi:hypothetical protein